MASPLADDVTKRLEAHGLDAAGAAWCLKALHPAGATQCDGVPDDSYCLGGHFETRGQHVISAPAGLSSAVWDCWIIKTNTDTLPVIWKSGNAGLNLSTTPLELGAIPAYVPEFVSTPLTPVSVGAPSAYNLRTAPDRRRAWRTSYASVTAYLTASSLNDGGTVYSAQFPPSLSQTSASLYNGNTQDAVASWYLATLPDDEDEMARMNPRYRMTPAREGVYMPTRLCGPDRQFRRRVNTNTVITSTGQLSVGPETVYSVIEPAPGFVTIDSVVPYSLHADCTAVGVVIFRGLSPQASVTVRSILGNEIEYAPSSASSPFTRVPPRYDPRALEAYYRVCYETADSYPASWNSFGTLLSKVASTAKALWPTFRPLVSKIPIAGGVLEAIGDELVKKPKKAKASVRRSELVERIRTPQASTVITERVKPRRRKRPRAGVSRTGATVRPIR